MKRLLPLFVFAVLTLPFAGCDMNKKKEVKTETDTTVTTPEGTTTTTDIHTESTDKKEARP
jgi:hypothetical protein